MGEYPGLKILMMLFAVCVKEILTLQVIFFLTCPDFREYFDSLWSNLCLKVTANNPLDGGHIAGFLMSLDQHQKAMLLPGCLLLPFDSSTVTVIIRYITSAIGKIYKPHTERLNELGAPWLTN